MTALDGIIQSLTHHVPAFKIASGVANGPGLLTYMADPDNKLRIAADDHVLHVFVDLPGVGINTVDHRFVSWGVNPTTGQKQSGALTYTNDVGDFSGLRMFVIYVDMNWGVGVEPSQVTPGHGAEYFGDPDAADAPPWLPLEDSNTVFWFDGQTTMAGSSGSLLDEMTNSAVGIDAVVMDAGINALFTADHRALVGQDPDGYFYLRFTGVGTPTAGPNDGQGYIIQNAQVNNPYLFVAVWRPRQSGQPNNGFLFETAGFAVNPPDASVTSFDFFGANGVFAFDVGAAPSGGFDFTATPGWGLAAYDGVRTARVLRSGDGDADGYDLIEQAAPLAKTPAGTWPSADAGGTTNITIGGRAQAQLGSGDFAWVDGDLYEVIISADPANFDNGNVEAYLRWRYPAMF